MTTQCAGCQAPILDKYVFNVVDQSWHDRCLQCYDCSNHLTEKCFYKEGKLFCRPDFYKRYGTKCGSCGQGIGPTDLVRKAKSKVFHVKCFKCMICRKQLCTGEELYFIDGGDLYVCREDYILSYQPQYRFGRPSNNYMQDLNCYTHPNDANQDYEFKHLNPEHILIPSQEFHHDPSNFKNDVKLSTSSTAFSLCNKHEQPLSFSEPFKKNLLPSTKPSKSKQKSSPKNTSNPPSSILSPIPENEAKKRILESSRDAVKEIDNAGNSSNNPPDIGKDSSVSNENSSTCSTLTSKPTKKKGKLALSTSSSSANKLSAQNQEYNITVSLGKKGSSDHTSKHKPLKTDFDMRELAWNCNYDPNDVQLETYVSNLNYAEPLNQNFHRRISNVDIIEKETSQIKFDGKTNFNENPINPLDTQYPQQYLKYDNNADCCILTENHIQSLQGIKIMPVGETSCEPMVAHSHLRMTEPCEKGDLAKKYFIGSGNFQSFFPTNHSPEEEGEEGLSDEDDLDHEVDDEDCAMYDESLDYEIEEEGGTSDDDMENHDRVYQDSLLHGQYPSKAMSVDETNSYSSYLHCKAGSSSNEAFVSGTNSPNLTGPTLPSCGGLDKSTISGNNSSSNRQVFTTNESLQQSKMGHLQKGGNNPYQRHPIGLESNILMGGHNPLLFNAGPFNKNYQHHHHHHNQPPPQQHRDGSTFSSPSPGLMGNMGCGMAGPNSNNNNKRRGPRTTIKAKQLETLKSAFCATPKPTRHIREQLARETGLNMRVIQVWFQNRRSKERRMKQLSAMGARRHFFRHTRRIRSSMIRSDHGNGGTAAPTGSIALPYTNQQQTQMATSTFKSIDMVKIDSLPLGTEEVLQSIGEKEVDEATDLKLSETTNPIQRSPELIPLAYGLKEFNSSELFPSSSLRFLQHPPIANFSNLNNSVDGVDYFSYNHQQQMSHAPLNQNTDSLPNKQSLFGFDNNNRPSNYYYVSSNTHAGDMAYLNCTGALYSTGQPMCTDETNFGTMSFTDLPQGPFYETPSITEFTGL